jgi:hypothetical protein
LTGAVDIPAARDQGRRLRSWTPRSYTSLLYVLC